MQHNLHGWFGRQLRYGLVRFQRQSRAFGQHARAISAAGTTVNAVWANMDSAAGLCLLERKKRARMRQSAPENPYMSKYFWADFLCWTLGLAFLAQVMTKNSLGWELIRDGRQVLAGQWWRLLTCSFVHAGPRHLLSNLYFLTRWGPRVERHYGHSGFLVLYFGSALSGSLLTTVMKPYGHSLGASSALYGLLASEHVYFHHGNRHLSMDKTRRDKRQMHLSKQLLGAVLWSFFPGVNIWGHLGGFVGGLALAKLLVPDQAAAPNSADIRSGAGAGLDAKEPKMAWQGAGINVPKTFRKALSRVGRRR